MTRFTLDGSDTLETRLALTCDKVLAGVKSLVPASALEGLLLGGGYGRGEGGVLRAGGEDLPYNDLEFYVFARGNAILAERKFRHALHELGESLSPDAGLEVEFKTLTLDKLRNSPPSMFYYDLVAGHRWLLGDDSLLTGCERHRDPASIPLGEATRLLMNRCSGLLFSLERLNRPQFDPDEADFVGRNLAKAQLAFGDVLLTARRQYHWSCRERHARLAAMPFEGDLAWARPLLDHHAAGVAFKLHPSRSTESRETLAARHADLRSLGGRLWLWLESLRLGARFASTREYALGGVNKCPETSPWKNRLLNLRAFGASALTSNRYPRERLFHALTLLLWEPTVLTEPALRAAVRRDLNTPASDLPGLVAAYTRLWSRFN